MSNIVILCIVSMLTYISKEMVYPILPLYLVETLGIAPYLMGLIEGISKSLASIIKFYSGYFSDKRKERKKLVIIGFIGDFLHKIFLFLANNWFFVFLAKLVEQFGKGIRIAPKDAIIAENAKAEKKSTAFGIQRAFDKLGAVIGIIISYILVSNVIDNYEYKSIFFISAIPVFIGIILLFFIKQEKVRGIFSINLKNFSPKMRFYYFIVFLSSLGNSTKSYLLLKASENVDPKTVIIFYLLTNLTTCLFAYPIGKFCEKVNKKNILSLAYFIFGITYLGLTFTENSFIIGILFISYGIFIALISVGSKSFIIENIKSDMKATAFGINECLIGLATLPASIIAGFLWTAFNSNISFYFSSLIAFLSSLLVIFILPKKKT